MPDFDLLKREERATIEDALVSLQVYAALFNDWDDDPVPVTLPSVMMTMTQKHDATAVARLIHAEIIALDSKPNASRKPLTLALDDHGSFDTHILAMLDCYWWQPVDYERAMVAAFGGILAFANAENIDLHRMQLVARGFLEPTDKEGIYETTKLGQFALDNGLNPGVAYNLASEAVAAMPKLVNVIPEF